MKIFLEVSASAMVKLKAGNKSNVNYNLAKGVGTNRLDESESRFPEGQGYLWDFWSTPPISL